MIASLYRLAASVGTSALLRKRASPPGISTTTLYRPVRSLISVSIRCANSSSVTGLRAALANGVAIGGMSRVGTPVRPVEATGAVATSAVAALPGAPTLGPHAAQRAIDAIRPPTSAAARRDVRPVCARRRAPVGRLTVTTRGAMAAARRVRLALAHQGAGGASPDSGIFRRSRTRPYPPAA